MTERQKGLAAWQPGIEEILAQEVAQRAEALNAEMLQEIEQQERRKKTLNKRQGWQQYGVPKGNVRRTRATT